MPANVALKVLAGVLSGINQDVPLLIGYATALTHATALSLAPVLRPALIRTAVTRTRTRTYTVDV